MRTRIPIVALVIVAFIIGLSNVLLTGRLSAGRPWVIVEQIVLIGFVYWWYHADKAEREYHAGALLNVAVVALWIVAVPVYLFRSRGAKQGAIAFVYFLVSFAATVAAAVFGGIVGKYVAP